MVFFKNLFRKFTILEISWFKKARSHAMFYYTVFIFYAHIVLCFSVIIVFLYCVYFLYAHSSNSYPRLICLHFVLSIQYLPRRTTGLIIHHSESEEIEEYFSEIFLCYIILEVQGPAPTSCQRPFGPPFGFFGFLCIFSFLCNFWIFGLFWIF